MTSHVRPLGPSDAPELEALREACFGRSPDFTSPSGMRFSWCPMDDAGVVLGAFSATGELVSTMRSNVLHAQSELPDVTARAYAARTPFPTLYLSKAATHPAYETVGLNCLLRLHFLTMARNEGLASLSGFVTNQATRARTLTRLGYEFFVGEAEDEGWRAKRGSWCFIVLDVRSKGEGAARDLNDMTARLQTEFPYVAATDPMVRAVSANRTHSLRSGRSPL